MKKNYILILSLLLLLIIFVIITVFSPSLFKKTIPRTVNVFGSPQSQIQKNFPKDKPEFTAVIGAIRPTSVNQNSISIYRIGDAKKTPLFERSFYADGFRGNKLSYIFSSGSAEFTQTGTLSTLGCISNDCILQWSNYYTWDINSHTFILNNVSHRAEFQQLLTTYRDIDKKGCRVLDDELISSQDRSSFTEIYEKDPTAPYYCSKKQGILATNIVFFLQAEKLLQVIVNGGNMGSNDIRNINL